MSVHDELGTRIKENYESVTKYKLVRRMPVIVRIDGKAFHTFTRGFDKPFDNILIASMQDTMKYLCEHVQGCVLGYTQSDEISLILIDYQDLNTSAWFDYRIDKVCSISASIATLAFNKAFVRHFSEQVGHESNDELLDRYCSAMERGAMFDARCFNVPKEEVTNVIYWRQLDAIRNSVQMVGQANFSQKELQGKSCQKIKEMLISEKNIDWDKDFAPYLKWGSCCIKKQKMIDYKTFRNQWIVDKNIPIFKGEGREYIDKLACL